MLTSRNDGKHSVNKLEKNFFLKKAPERNKDLTMLGKRLIGIVELAEVQHSWNGIEGEQRRMGESVREGR